MSNQSIKITRLCEHCGITFLAFPCDIARGYARFCSRPCANLKRPVMPVAERFWSFVNKTDGCWIWTGAKDADGYGHFTIRRQRKCEQFRSHRMSWILTFGELAADILVLHNCDKNYPCGDISYRLCVRPEHLWLGTNIENIRDMDEKRRRAIGHRNGTAKLTDDKVRYARQQHAAGRSIVSIAKELEVTQSVMGKAISGQLWKHVT